VKGGKLNAIKEEKNEVESRTLIRFNKPPGLDCPSRVGVFLLGAGGMSPGKAGQSYPQLEDGYTRIATALLENLAKSPGVPPYMRVYFYIIRMTYGYHRKDVVLRNRDIVNACGIRRRNVWKEIKRLESTGMINVIRSDDNKEARYSINKKKEEYKATSTLMSLKKRHLIGCQMSSSQMSNDIQSDDPTFKDKYKDKLNVCVRPSPKTSTTTNGNSPPEQDSKQHKHNFASPLNSKRQEHELPDDFEMSERMKSYAESKGMDAGEMGVEFEKFCAYNQGLGKKRKNWEAVWRFWCIKWVERKGGVEEEDQAERVLRQLKEEGNPGHDGG
jgi:DNA-binding MarR family transcriptional regulator